MLMDGLRIHQVAYGIYRPALDNHEYRGVHLSETGPEPFNRGMDDASAQTGSITVDGLMIDDLRGGDQRHPVVHMSDNNLSGTAECHFRNVSWNGESTRRPVFNRGGSTRVDPFVEQGVPYYIHDYFGPGRHAKVVSNKAADLLKDGAQYHREPPLTGDESVVAEVHDVDWPQLLDPVDDLPPATVITSVRRHGDQLTVCGISHDNGEIVSVTVNGQAAELVKMDSGVVDWTVSLPVPEDKVVDASAADREGNREQTGHRIVLD
jgi:hypothetical protein